MGKHDGIHVRDDLSFRGREESSIGGRKKKDSAVAVNAATRFAQERLLNREASEPKRQLLSLAGKTRGSQQKRGAGSLGGARLDFVNSSTKGGNGKGRTKEPGVQRGIVGIGNVSINLNKRSLEELDGRGGAEHEILRLGRRILTNGDVAEKESWRV